MVFSLPVQKVRGEPLSEGGELISVGLKGEGSLETIIFYTTNISSHPLNTGRTGRLDGRVAVVLTLVA